MGTVQIKLEIPEELACALAPDGEDVSRRILEQVLLQSFQEGLISSGKAAELLKITKDDFLELLVEHDVPYFSQTFEEVLRDADVAASVSRALGGAKWEGWGAARRLER